MLIKFSVANFLSFKDEITVDLLAEKQVSELWDTNVFKVGRRNLLSGAVLYGANGSGKSNLFKALLFVKRFVHSSSKEGQKGDPIGVEPFRLSTETVDKPSVFELEFLMDGVKYRYGFELDKERVYGEWLYMTKKVKEYELFLREGDVIEVSQKHFKEGDGFEKITRKNALFLSVVAQFNGELSGQIVQWVANHLNVINGLQDKHFEGYTAKQLDDVSVKEKVLTFLNQADLGIEDILRRDVSTENVSAKLPLQLRELIKGGGYSLTTRRRCYDEDGVVVGLSDFDFENHESEGTKKYFRLSGPVLDTLQHGKVLFIDELDARLHPILTLNLIRFFNSPEINTKGAQLIFATHDSNLLASDQLRRDQICLTEKSQVGASDLYRLSSFRVRKDASHEKNYLKGRYGAIPFLSGMDLLVNSVTGGDNGK